MKKSKGFTLIEVTIVVAILGILAAMLLGDGDFYSYHDNECIYVDRLDRVVCEDD